MLELGFCYRDHEPSLLETRHITIAKAPWKRLHISVTYFKLTSGLLLPTCGLYILQRAVIVQTRAVEGMTTSDAPRATADSLFSLD